MLLVFSFSLGVLTRFSLFPGVNIYMQDIFIFLIILLNTKKITKYIFSKKNSGLIAFLCLFIISLVGIITHVSSVSEFFNSFLYLLRLYGYLLLLIPLVSMSIKRLNQLKVAMIISGFIFISFGYVQYLYYPNLRNLYYLGWDEHLSRLFSTLLDPNFAGTYILLILILFLSVVFEKFKSSKFKSKAFFYVGLFFVLASLLLTYSRSAYLVSVFSLSLFLYLLGYKKLIAILFVVLILGI